MKTTLPVKGMDCASCANIVTRAIKKTPGVSDTQVSIATNQVVIEYDPKKTTLDQINENVKKFGYSLETAPQMSMSEHAQHTSEEHAQMLAKQIKHLFPVSLLIFFLMLWDVLSKTSSLPPMPIPMAIFNWIGFSLALGTLVFFGQEFIASVPRFLRTGVASMDTLIGLGSITAFIYSTFVIFFPNLAMSIKLPENTYFDAVIVVIGFIKFGKFLEARSKQKTGQAIKELLKLSAKVALVERKGKEIEIPIDQVKVGDIIIVKPGAKVPVDGVITKGDTSINESMITGEPIPVDKKVGDEVVSGTINEQGYIKFRATKVGADTLLSQIIKMVENAQSSKAPIERLADTISSYFVPVVLGLATLSFVIWFVLGNLSLAITALVGILVIACPCALGLATPTAIIVGVGKGAQNGILVKDAEVLEKLHNITAVVFDKTGTITTGQPQVQEIVSTSKSSPDQILSVLASLEKKSDHPLAKAITKYAEDHKISTHTIQNFKDIPGKGISGQFKSQKFLAGNLTLLKENKIDFDKKEITKYTSKGMTPVFLTSDKKLLGAVFVSDSLKENSIDAIEKLHQMNIKTVMLTGDDRNTATFIASQAGIDRIYAEVLPNEKSQIIDKLKDEGNKVVMVGDGVNDSPALATADVGIAMSTGTDVAIESAGITLLHGDISKVEKAIKLSKATMRTIKQNLFWAFFYNVVLIPLAAGALFPFFDIILNPAFAGAAMAFSSVSVVTNSLRLKTIKI